MILLLLIIINSFCTLARTAEIYNYITNIASYACISVYIYIYIERERDVYVYIYIYMHTYTHMLVYYESISLGPVPRHPRRLADLELCGRRR